MSLFYHLSKHSRSVNRAPKHVSSHAHESHRFTRTFQFCHHGGVFVKVREGSIFYLTACLLDFEIFRHMVCGSPFVLLRLFEADLF